MVGSVSPERKADLEALLPKASYRITRDEEESVTTITTTKSWQQPETWFTDNDKVHFIPYDDLELGNCSKFEFRKAMNALWQAKGLPILPSEVEGWASMFDKKRNGVVCWRDF